MLALAAAELGLKVHVYAPEADSPAFDVAARHTVARLSTTRRHSPRFAARVSVVTYEFENVPAAPRRSSAPMRRWRPMPSRWRSTQDRLTEKTFLADLGIATATFAAVENEADLAEALRSSASPPS